MPETKNILIVDDDTYICNLLKNYLEQKGFTTDATYSGNTAKKLIKKNNFDLVLCDFRLPDSDGLKILKFIKSIRPSVPVIIMTAYAEVKMAVELIKQGAYDYITKPLQPEEVLSIISKALNTDQENLTVSSFGTKFITGKSEKINDVMQQVDVVAPTDITVLVEGETGSGKEYIARAIHFKSKRKDKPFVAVDCGAIPKELANSELFGHIKGAFTGAINDKKGVFEQARGGTLFLDEVGNLPHENQVKLLRALQERIITRVGDNKSIKVDVRLIAASNDSLFKKVEENHFREDLYHRLNGFKIQLPALRHRKEDIMEFTTFFIQEANKAFNKYVTQIDEPARDILMNYHWHGNIRELQNVINRMVLLSQGEVITSDLLPDEIRFNNLMDSGHFNRSSLDREVTDLKSATLVTEKEVIQNALIKSNNNKSKAAKLLNIDRKTLYNKIKLYDLEL
ncbi:MAG: sigma-54-dependent transcriptional regulator [Bacteroidales bacterium]